MGENPRPLAVNLISDIDLKNDIYYPVDKGQLCYSKIVKYLIDLGYFYNNGKYYQLYIDGLYYEVDIDQIKTDIYKLILTRTKGEFNTSPSMISSVLDQLQGTSNIYTLSQKYDDFLINHPEYDVNYPFIPMKNGLYDIENNTLLGHCGYLFNPSVLNVNYEKLTDDELFNSPIYDYFIRIIPDEETLKAFFYWVSSAIFDKKPLPYIMILYGDGGTGKTALSLSLSALLGHNLVSHLSIDQLCYPSGTAGLEGKLLNVIDETETTTNQKLMTGLIKRLSGGDFIEINPKYQKTRVIENKTRFMIIGNTYPEFDTSDGGIIRRIWPIECSVKQSMADRLHDVMTSDDVINWFFNMALWTYEHTTRDQPEKHISLKMIEARNNYLNMNGFNLFLSDYCGSLDIIDVQNKLNKLPIKIVYEEYKSSIYDNGGTALSMRKFGEKLRLRYNLETYVKGDTKVYRPKVV